MTLAAEFPAYPTFTVEVMTDGCEMRGALKERARPEARSARRRRRPSWADVALWQLPGASAFSSDPPLCDPLSLIAEFRRHPFAAALRELTDTSPTSFGFELVDGGRKLGRPRLRGDWSSLYLAYVLSGITALQPFWQSFCSTELWSICGVDRRPSYQELDLRFGELEECWEKSRTSRSRSFRSPAERTVEWGRSWL